MTKKQPTQNAYLIGRHLVVLERIQNDRNGNPRYKAFITDLDEAKARVPAAATVFVYTFQGWYEGEYASARAILTHHLREQEA